MYPIPASNESNSNGLLFIYCAFFGSNFVLSNIIDIPITTTYRLIFYTIVIMSIYYMYRVLCPVAKNKKKQFNIDLAHFQAVCPTWQGVYHHQFDDHSRSRSIWGLQMTNSNQVSQVRTAICCI